MSVGWARGEGRDQWGSLLGMGLVGWRVCYHPNPSLPTTGAAPTLHAHMNDSGHGKFAPPLCPFVLLESSTMTLSLLPYASMQGKRGGARG